MPRTVALPNQLALAWMSLWYQETPNGAVGCWITNRSNPALAGMPCRFTVMVSLSAPGVIVTCPPAFGRHAEMADDDGLSANENDDAAADRACVPPVAAPAVVVRLSAAATTPAAAMVTAFAAVGARMLRMLGRLLLIAGPPVTAAAPPPPSGRPGGRRAVVSRAGVRTGMPEWFNSGMGMFGRGAGAGGGRLTRAAADDVMVTELYRQYRGPLLSFVLRLTAGDRQHAEDIVQETMVRAWRQARRLDLSEPSLMPWLATVARRIVIDEHRRKRTRPVEIGGAEVVDRAPAAADETENLLRKVLVAEALQELSPAHRDVLNETILRDRTVNEAAEVLGIPVGTVKSRVYYALKALRVALAERGVSA